MAGWGGLLRVSKSNIRRALFLEKADLLQYKGGWSLQLVVSAPIFSPRSTRSFIVCFLKAPGSGGAQSPGMDTTRTSTFALRLSRAISAMAKRWRTAVAVEARVAVHRLRSITAIQFDGVISATGRN